MVNDALRTMDVCVIIKLGFFIRDLHEHITRLESEQASEHHHTNSFVVYYGQGLSQSDFDELLRKQDGLLAFNHFLLTSKNQQVPLNLARQTLENSNMMGILFVMAVDPSVCSVPFANVRKVSYHQNEEEILFSMHSIFRIGEIKKIEGNNRLWQVDLTLTSDNDPQLYVLTEHIREEILPHETGWYRLGNFLVKVGQYVEAEQVFEMLLTETTDNHKKANIYQQLGFINDDQGKYTEAIALYEKSLAIKQQILPPNHPDLATSYNHIGKVYYNMDENIKALSFYEKLLEINEKSLPTNHPDLASSYTNIGNVYEKIGEYSKALAYYEKTLQINEKSLPPNHPDLASSYNNIGNVYEKIGEYAKALTYYEKTLQINEKSLPPNHPYLATSYNNIGNVYDKMGNYSKALSSYERALDIEQRSLPVGHPSLQLSKDNIEAVKKKL